MVMASTQPEMIASLSLTGQIILKHTRPESHAETAVDFLFVHRIQSCCSLNIEGLRGTCENASREGIWDGQCFNGSRSTER